MAHRGGLNLGFEAREVWYRGASLIRTPPPVGPCSGPMHMVILGGWVFLMSEVPLYAMWCFAFRAWIPIRRQRGRQSYLTEYIHYLVLE